MIDQMNINEVIQNIVMNIPKDHQISPEFIKFIRIKDQDHQRYILRGEEITKFLQNPRSFESIETSVVLDTEKMADTIIGAAEYVWQTVERMQEDRFRN